MRLVSWNVNQLDVRDWLAGTGADLALLQEAPQHPTAMADRTSGVPMQVLPDDDAAWETCGWERRLWRTAIVQLSGGH